MKPVILKAIDYRADDAVESLAGSGGNTTVQTIAIC